MHQISVAAFESGTYQSGTYTRIASTQQEAEQVQMEPGVLYEQRISLGEPISGTLLGIIQGAILGIEQTFGMVKVTYWEASGTEIVYQFMIPSGTAVTFIAPVIWAVIFLVLAVLTIIAVISWVVFRVDIFGVGTILKLIPGIVVTAVGGIVMSVLPGKAKIAGVVPLGIGLWLLISPFLPPPGPSGCENHATESECTAGGCYWYDNACHSTQPGGEAAEIIGINAS
jgi:hypothetical protein